MANFNRSRAKCIDWLEFNLALCRRYLNMDGLLAIAIDPSYISKFSLSCYLPLNIFFMSFSLLSASTGVRLLMSRPRISSRICESTGSSSWKKLCCMSGVEVRCDVLARPTLRGALPSVPCSLCRWHHTMESIPLNKTASPCLPWPGNKAQGNRIQKRGGTHDIWLPHCLSLFLLLWEGI